jgi:hypothetical protein
MDAQKATTEQQYYFKKTKFEKWQAFGESEIANIFIGQQNHNAQISNARHLIGFEKLIIKKV